MNGDNLNILWLE